MILFFWIIPIEVSQKKRRLIEDEDEEVGNIPEPAPLSNISNRLLRNQTKKLKKIAVYFELN